MSEEYQKGDLKLANAAKEIAQQNFDRAERALAVARADLTKAERHASDRFRALSRLAEVKPALTPNATYPTRNGPSVYVGIDSYHGQTTYEFSEPGNPRQRYVLPEHLSDYLTTGDTQEFSGHSSFTPVTVKSSHG